MKDDFDLPDLPSDEELGITDEDRKKLENMGEGEGGELTEEEMETLLGGGGTAAPPKAPPTTGEGEPPSDEKPAPPREPEPEGPRSRWKGPVTLGLLLLAAWLFSSSRIVPAPVPANAPDTAFSSSRAMAHLVEIARTAHPPGSPEHARVREYLVDRLEDLGLDPMVQTTTSMIGRGDIVRAATVRNVLARIPGTDNSGAILLTAHYDGREISKAAGDDGSGVVTILETVRALLSGPPLRNDVLVLLTDAEELGLLGARAFVDDHPWMDEIKAVLSIEMRGGGGPSIMFEPGWENGWIIDAMAQADPRPFTNSLSYEIYKNLPNDTDFTPFKEADKQGLNFAAIGRASVYHQEYDSPANLSEGTLQHHGIHVLSMVRHLGAADLSGTLDAPDVNYFSLPMLGVVSYGMGWVLPLSGIVLLLAVLVVLTARQKGAGWSGILVGLGSGLVAVSVAAGVGHFLMQWLPGFHPEYGSLHGSAFHHEGWYVLSLAAMALALVSGIFGLARRWFGAPGLVAGALLLPALAAVAVSFYMPAAALNLQWPVLAALLAAFALLVPTRSRLSVVAWLVTVLLALPVLVLLVPITEFAWLALSFRAAMQLGGLVTLILLMLLPALLALREPNAWWAPLTGLVLAGVFLGLGIRAAQPTADRPAPSTLLYAYDHGDPEALWITDGSDAEADAEARAWVADRVSADFTGPTSLEAFGFRQGARPTTPAPMVDVQPPTVARVSDVVVDGVRRMELAVRSEVGAELMVFLFSEDDFGRVTAVNGRAVPTDDRALRVEHWGTPVGAVLLTMELPPQTEPNFTVVEHLLRPEEILGSGFFQRPPHLAPDITELSDRAMLRTPLDVVEVRDEPFFEILPSPGMPAEADSASGAGEAPEPVAPADTTAAEPDTAGALPDTTGATREPGPQAGRDG